MYILTKDIDNTQRKTRHEVESYAVLALLREHYGYEVALSHLDNGQPYLPKHPEYISISHTVGRVALAVSSSPIGIDIEKMDARIVQITPRILLPKTREKVMSYAESIRTSVCHILWTSAEALYKLIPESKLISDFDYLLDTLYIDEANNTFKLSAYYIPVPSELLAIEGRIEGNYILTIATH